MERDIIIKDIFECYISNANLSDYTFDMETGTFNLANPPAKEEVPIKVPETVSTEVMQ